MFKKVLYPLVPLLAVMGLALGTGSGAFAANGPARPAIAFPTGSIASPEQAGWAATHGQFNRARQFVKLFDLGNFASEVGSIGYSVQLWSANKVVVLGISTCATTDCKTGSTTVHSEAWNAALAVYDSATHVLVHSDGASPSMAVGNTALMRILYNKTTGNIAVLVQTGSQSFARNYFAGPGISFSQARFSVETSAVSPWGPPAFTYDAPAAPTTLTNGIGGVSLTNYAGTSGGLQTRSWGAQRITWTRNGMATGAVNATASALLQSGSAFMVTLQP